MIFEFFNSTSRQEVALTAPAQISTALAPINDPKTLHARIPNKNIEKEANSDRVTWGAFVKWTWNDPTHAVA